MFQILYFLVHFIQPILVPLCFVCAWLLVILLSWSFYSAIAEGMNRAKQMHSVPCAECRYFTDDYHLKCTVRPSCALTEEAINCPDYEPLSGYSLYSRKTL